MEFKDYQFKPENVIEGLNSYYNSVNRGCTLNNAFMVHWKFGKIISWHTKHIAEAINWLREEHDIFYTPGMKAPVDDFDVDEAAKEYEKATRTSDIFCEENLDMVSVAKVREALGIAEDSDIFEAIARMKKSDERAHSEMYKARGEKYELLKQVREILGLNPEVGFLEALKCARGDMDAATRLRLESSELSHRNRELCRRIADIRQAAGMKDDDPSDLVKYVKALREANEELADHRVAEGWLRKENSDLAIKVSNLEEQLRVLRYDILKVYREIFDCSNGDPEGTDEETMQDILTEYKRVLKLKDDAETDTVKWRPYIADILGMDKGSDWSDICIRARVTRHDRDNFDLCLKMLEKHIKEAYSEVFQDDADKHWFGHGCQAVTDIVEELKRERAIKEEAEEKAIKYKELAKENRVQWNSTNVQLQWAQQENLEWLKRYEKLKSELDEMKRSYGESVITSGGLCEDLTEEREKVKRLEQKLNEIHDICER